MFICSFLLVYSLQVKLLSLCLFINLHWFIHCRYSFYLHASLLICIDSFIVSIAFNFMFICYSCIDSFIVAKVSIFMFICSYVLIPSLQVHLLSSCLFVLIYWFIHCRYSFYLYVYLFFVLIHSLQIKILSL